MAHLAIGLMGAFDVSLDGEPVTWFQSDKVRALLAFVAVESHTRHTRHALAGLLWPNVPEARALHSLSQAVSNLRSVLKDHATTPPSLVVTPHTIQFNCASDCWLDVEEFGRLLRRGTGRAGPSVPSPSPDIEALHQAVGLYRGPFLYDLSLVDGIGFEEWTLVQRERLQRLLMDALYLLASVHEARGELEEALRCARRQVELEPWREEAHVQVMRLLARNGRRSEALAQYGLCRRLLASELDVEPAAETTRLYEQIRDGRLGVQGRATD